MIKKLLVGVFFTTLLFGATNDTKFIKEKLEIKELKKELNTFYNKKEKEYQNRKKELDKIVAQITSEKRQIEKIKNENLQILKDIKAEVQNKTTKIYNGMKPKIAAQIFDKMISEGKIEDVFDIILKLKEKKVTLLMKFLSVKNASTITEMLRNYNLDNK